MLSNQHFFSVFNSIFVWNTYSTVQKSWLTAYFFTQAWKSIFGMTTRNSFPVFFVWDHCPAEKRRGSRWDTFQMVLHSVSKSDGTFMHSQFHPFWQDLLHQTMTEPPACFPDGCRHSQPSLTSLLTTSICNVSLNQKFPIWVHHSNATDFHSMSSVNWHPSAFSACFFFS